MSTTWTPRDAEVQRQWAWDSIRDQLETMLDQEETSYRVRALPPSSVSSLAPLAATLPAAPSPAPPPPPPAPRDSSSLPYVSWSDGPLPPFAFADGGDLDLCRRKMCEWAFNVVDYFDYSRDLVSTSLSLVDRYVASSPAGSICKRRFQSISVAALYMTLKTRGPVSSAASPATSKGGRAGERPRRHVNIRTFVELSRGILTAESLEEEERLMLQGLHYKIHPPTPVAFVEYLVPLMLSSSRRMAHRAGAGAGAGSSSEHSGPGSPPRMDEATLHYVYELSRYYTELSVFERDLSVRHKPSCVAFASVLNALSAVDGSGEVMSSSFWMSSSSSSPWSFSYISPMLRLNREEVQDAWASLRKLCPLDTLEWPGGAGGGGADSSAHDNADQRRRQQQKQRGGDDPSPSSDSDSDGQLSQISPTTVFTSIRH